MSVPSPQERSSSPRPAKPSPQARERANKGPRAPLRRSPDEDRGCATDHEGAGYHEALARDLAPELLAEVVPAPLPDGSVSATGVMVPAGMWRCCPSMQPEEIGDCGEGCCTDYRCRSCRRTWRREWSD
jgi:hypothetical protein